MKEKKEASRHFIALWFVINSLSIAYFLLDGNHVSDGIIIKLGRVNYALHYLAWMVIKIRNNTILFDDINDNKLQLFLSYNQLIHVH